MHNIRYLSHDYKVNLSLFLYNHASKISIINQLKRAQTILVPVPSI